jgi:oligoendopeptidase F
MNPLDNGLPRWNLAPLAPPDDVDELLREAAAAAASVGERWPGRISAATADDLGKLLDEVGAVRTGFQRLAAYLSLRFADGTADERDLDLDTALTRAAASAEAELDFIEDELGAIPDDRMAALSAGPALAPYREYLAALRRAASRRLPPPVEQAVAARAPASTAWAELYEDELSAISVDCAGQACTIEEAMALLAASEPETRRAAHRALAGALAPRAGLAARCLHNIVADRLAVDRLRGRSHPREERDAENALPRRAVDDMLGTVRDHGGLARGWWRTKARLLGVGRLEASDMRAPVGDGHVMSYRDAMRLITEALAAISADLAAPVVALTTAETIDAGARPGKSGNAFCLWAAPDVPPYVHITYGGGLRDLLRLAHEVGHAVHYTLAARRQPPLVTEAGVVTSELAAFLVEALVAHHAVRVLPAQQAQALKIARADYAVDAVFRQCVITAWETQVYATVADDLRLQPEALGDLWLTEYAALTGDTVTLPDDYRYDWMRVSHMFHERFYNYAYVFSYLAALAAERRWSADADADADAGPAAPALIDMLSLGGSAGTLAHLDALGLPAELTHIWTEALAGLGTLVTEASCDTTNTADAPLPARPRRATSGPEPTPTDSTNRHNADTPTRPPAEPRPRPGSPLP